MKVPEEYRVKTGELGSTDWDGNNGCFVIPFESRDLVVVASDGAGWDHVSVSLPTRCPNWREMCYVKSLFWNPDDCVVQFHPPETEYVNNHEFCLHLWKPHRVQIPTPPSILVGIKRINR